MPNLLLESVRTLVLLGLFLYLWSAGKGRSRIEQEGWRLILAGFFLLFAGSLVGLTGYMDALNRFTLIPNVGNLVFLGERLLFLGGVAVLAFGVLHRMQPNTKTCKTAWSVGSPQDHKHAAADYELLMLAIEQAKETIVITDADGGIQYANPAFETTTGYTREEAVGQNPRILKSGKHDAAFYKAMWDTLAGGETWSGEIINRKRTVRCIRKRPRFRPSAIPRGKR